jgi:5-methylcytosine-specific restriction endonuclease McrA
MLAALRALPEGEKARRRERHRADLRRYWADGRTKEKADAWRHKNREHVNAYYRQRYRDHTERVNGYIKKWQERNGERYRALGQRYQERLVAAPGHYTGQDLKALYHAQLGLCAYCQKTLEGGYSIDHKQPVSRGGSNWPDNLCLCCRRCNSRKGPKTAEEFCAWLTAPRP